MSPTSIIQRDANNFGYLFSYHEFTSSDKLHQDLGIAATHWSKYINDFVDTNRARWLTRAIYSVDVHLFMSTFLPMPDNGNTSRINKFMDRSFRSIDGVRCLEFHLIWLLNESNCLIRTWFVYFFDFFSQTWFISLHSSLLVLCVFAHDQTAMPYPHRSVHNQAIGKGKQKRS